MIEERVLKISAEQVMDINYIQNKIISEAKEIIKNNIGKSVQNAVVLFEDKLNDDYITLIIKYNVYKKPRFLKKRL
ncbi:MAG TPA: hypothetical protein V6C58_11790 [Allocoleopsis sp.]